MSGSGEGRGRVMPGAQWPGRLAYLVSSRPMTHEININQRTTAKVDSDSTCANPCLVAHTEQRGGELEVRGEASQDRRPITS